MTTTPSEIHSQKFRAALALLSQQSDSRLAASVMSEGGTGKTHWYDAIGSTAAQQIVSRFADTPNNSIDFQRTRIDLAGYNNGIMLDNIDAASSTADPRSRYVQASHAAMNRAKDDVIVASFFAASLRGETGATSTAFPAGNQVAVDSWAYGAGSGNSGLTVSKLISAKVLLLAGNVDPEEPIYIGYTSKQLGNMLATTEATSADFSSVKALVNGTINSFMGMTFIPTERLGLDSNSYRRVPVWQRSGMFLAVGKDIKAEVGPRADKNYNWQIYNEMFLGAARVEDAKVIEIKCAE